ncbi:hypothetical protein J7412_20055 [Shimia sp. R9_3]|nr:hypothetical protein [Shimia sp. R9_3]
MLHELFKFSVTTVLVGGAALVYDALSKRADERHEKAEKEREDRKADLERERETREALQERIRERAAAQRRQLEHFLREATDAYNEIKYIRRELRNALSSQENGTFHVGVERYCQLLRSLNRGQLKLEQFRRILMSKPDYLSFLGEQAADWLADAEEYLRHVTQEYEYRRLENLEDGTLIVDPKSKLFQYVVSRSNEHHDGSSMTMHFRPLDKFFQMLASHIEQAERLPTSEVK